MTTYKCRPTQRPLDATVSLPGSKSITNRALVTAGLADGTSLLRGILLAEDTRLMIDALRALGIAVTIDEAACVAEVSGSYGRIPADQAKIGCGNAGTVLRFVTALAALGHGRYELDGVARMRERPIGGLVEILRALGAHVEYTGQDGFPPLTVHSYGLSGGHVSFHSPPSSQLVSAVLVAAPCAARDVLLDVTGELPSKPYLKMTTEIMSRFGVAVVEQYQSDGAKFIVAAPQRYQATPFAVEPDASNATYFLAAPAIAGGCVTVQGLGTDSIQGDARFVDVLEKMGCRVERAPNQLTVHGPGGGSKLRGVDLDLNDMPDTVQTLAVLALFAEGTTLIRNVANLRVKETDRLTALRQELGKLGAKVDELRDGLRIHPPERVTPAAIDTYNDHRMAMSFALVGLKVPGLEIRNPQCCAKTFPDFFARFEALSGTK